MTCAELKVKTKKFAVDNMKYEERMPTTFANREIGRPLIHSGTSLEANYSASLSGKSKPDFINKIALVELEAKDSLVGLEIIEDAFKDK